MSDYIVDSPNVTSKWCPTCRPDADPMKELLEESYCDMHRQGLMGSEDILVSSGHTPTSSVEADGHDCREFQRLIR